MVLDRGAKTAVVLLPKLPPMLVLLTGVVPEPLRCDIILRPPGKLESEQQVTGAAECNVSAPHQ